MYVISYSHQATGSHVPDSLQSMLATRNACAVLRLTPFFSRQLYNKVSRYNESQESNGSCQYLQFLATLTSSQSVILFAEVLKFPLQNSN